MNYPDKSREDLLQELQEIEQAYHSLKASHEKYIADQKLIESELRTRERRFKQVVENAGEWIWEVDPNGLYTYSSPVVEKILGYTPEELIGKKYFYDLFFTGDGDRLKKMALQYFNSKKPIKDFVNRNVRKDGTLVWLSTTGSPIIDNQGTLLGYQGVDTDITERKKVEEALKESEFFFKESQKAAFIGSYKTDFIKGTWESSEVLDQIFGIDKEYERTVPGWIDLVYPGDREMMNSYLVEEVMGKRKHFNKEYRIIRKSDGQTRWVLGQGKADFDPEGNALSLIGTIQDITEHKLDEEIINKLKYAVEASNECVFMTDLEGIFNYVNPAFTAIYGFKAKEVIGKVTPRILKSGLMDEAAYQHFWKELLNNQVISGELINRTKDGRYIRVEGSSNSVRNEVGEVIGFISIQKDITARKKIEEELVFAKEKAEESDRLKSAFLANMSHEIRTPMNGILGYASLLSKRGLESAEQEEYIRMIEKSSDRMLNIINEIMDISKIESGQMEVVNRETNINEQLEQVYRLLKPDADGKGLILSLNNSLPACEAFIKTDKEKLYSVLTNLVKNAIKYTDRGSVEFGYIKKGEELEFYVKDTGIGIPEKRHEAIFERFIQADVSDLQARQGAGLGLSIAKAFVEMLGGKIWLGSKVGKGSIFYFTLPYNVEEDAIPLIEESSKEFGAEYQVKSLKILIAEDDDTSEKLIRIHVREFSREVLLARSGLEAVEIFRNHPDVDLILMDIQMPGLNGYEATRLIRELSKEVIIIAQTAFGLVGDREKALGVGCTDYLSKPITKDRLSAIIQKYFN